MPRTAQAHPPETNPDPNYDRDAIYDDAGPFRPSFVDEAVRAMMRTLPLDDNEDRGWAYRRMHSALTGLAALHPRDEIEMMLGVQAMAAYHAAASCWHVGMNLQRPFGNSTRHINTAANAARTFAAMLTNIDRRQARPLFVPTGRPPSKPRSDEPNAAAVITKFENRCRNAESNPDPKRSETPLPDIEWTAEALALAEEYLKQARTDKENEGLDIANTEGILPGGGMIVMDDPTPNQIAYMGRRLALMYRREYDENLRKGINKYPRIRGIRTGDLIP